MDTCVGYGVCEIVMGESMAVILFILLFLTSVISFNRITKKEEYKDLIESGQKINLNLLTLISAYWRHKDDPLRPTHIRIAKIGFRYMLFITIMIPAIFFISALIGK